MDFLENQIGNLNFIEEIYHQYLANPEKIDPSWKSYFETPETSVKQENISGKERIHQLIQFFRNEGHLYANINPIQLKASKEVPLHFNDIELKELHPTFGLLPKEQAPLSEILAVLKKLYCSSVGFELKAIENAELRQWILQQIESGKWHQPLTPAEKQEVLDALTKTEALEFFLHTKHVGKKRFSLEGGETLIAMLRLMTAHAAEHGVKEFFIGMSHRGRLNVLANLLNKSIASILADFDDDYVPAPTEGMGDMRYHKGHANDEIKTYLGKMLKLTIAPNPSHLESVNPVVEGLSHAKQFLAGDEKDRKAIVPLLIHGDASLAGQGIVYETLQMSNLKGFETGGTLHIVINNQIGFTTSPAEGRSTRYCTDIAKAFGIPVFHLNVEDPEMCVQMMLFAFEIRRRFHTDVFIDLYCYRKYGHNEGDEPAFTQPLVYQIIKKKKSIRALYLEQLIQSGFITKEAAEQHDHQYKDTLQNEYMAASSMENSHPHSKPKVEFEAIETKVEWSILEKIAHSFSHIPNGFHLHPKLAHLFNERDKEVSEGVAIDWSLAEFLAYGTLVLEKIPVRLVGQDTGRGTFSQRHAIWVDQEDNHPYYPLSHLHADQARFEALNTCLSEAAALGFEYGYSIVCSHGLNIWEAQYGDFANSAQVIIDQYIASGEEKWGQKSNITLFLPHGFEGQGPEHSSARFERFLALAGHTNMQICYPTLPAQIFHLLRRQAKQTCKKPLIVLTPKGLLRDARCKSELRELSTGRFEPFLDDQVEPVHIKKLIFCSGRIYFDLNHQRHKDKRTDIAIIRIEQLYPLNTDQLSTMIQKYDQIEECLWVQEEPENMGAWPYISFYLPKILPKGIPYAYAGRERSASPATGFFTRHKEELSNIMKRVF